MQNDNMETIKPFKSLGDLFTKNPELRVCVAESIASGDVASVNIKDRFKNGNGLDGNGLDGNRLDGNGLEGNELNKKPTAPTKKFNTGK